MMKILTLAAEAVTIYRADSIATSRLATDNSSISLVSAVNVYSIDAAGGPGPIYSL